LGGWSGQEERRAGGEEARMKGAISGAFKRKEGRKEKWWNCAWYVVAA